MLSHDFARLLLSRRNNDLAFIVEVVPPEEEEGRLYLTKLEDDHELEVHQEVTIKPQDLVKYDSLNDTLMVLLGPVFLSEED